MLPQIVMHANLVQVLGGLGKKIKNRLFPNSGWSIPDDTDTGISFGDGPEIGGGYMEMDVQDDRSDPEKKYEIRGGYVELGIGIGEISRGKAIIDRIEKGLKGIKPSSDLVAMPGGSLTALIMGPMQDKANLQLDDFKYSSWLYLHVGGELGLPSGNIGLIFMLDPKASPKLAAVGLGGLSAIPGGPIAAMMAGCLAWAPYWGLGVGVGLGAKAAARFIQTVHLTPA